ncbi:MAG TPA: hypothetical protein VNZ54_09110, partial [bacterium]|nr:hypothetical protein [bacterium]
MKSGLRAQRLLLVAAALSPAAQIWGAFTNLDSQLPVAESARLAGAGDATRQGAAAAGANPAALGLDDSTWLSVSGGNGGKDAQGSGAADLVVPVEDDLSLGLGWDADFGPGFAEHTLGLSAALEASPGLTLGLRGLLMQAADQSGFVSNGQGMAVDAGARWKAWSGGGRALVAGWWGSQLASQWPTRYWSLGVPTTQHLGLEWDDRSLGDLYVEYQNSSAGEDLPETGTVLRLGAETVVGARWTLGVGGAWGAGEDGGLYSAGVGVPFRVLGMKAKAAYSLLWESQQGLRQRLQIQLAWPTLEHGAVVAVPLKVEYEPGSKRIRSATLSISAPSDQSVQDWSLEIRDKSGHLVRVLRGSGTPPSLVTWDGKDSLGQAVATADSVTYTLNLRTGSGLRASPDALGLNAGVTQGGLSLLGSGADANSLVVPVYDADGKAVALTLRPPHFPGQTDHWQIQVQNAASDVLKQMQGPGAFPAQLTWDGNDEAGQRVLDQAGLRVRFNSFDPEGRVSSVDQALDTGLQPLAIDPETLPRLGLRLPSFRQGGPLLEMLLSDASLAPLSVPTPEPGVTELPTEIPTPQPTEAATPELTASPTAEPTAVPTALPTQAPTAVPTAVPTAPPTQAPTAVSTALPTALPTQVPTAAPTALPTALP